MGDAHIFGAAPLGDDDSKGKAVVTARMMSVNVEHLPEEVRERLDDTPEGVPLALDLDMPIDMPVRMQMVVLDMLVSGIKAVREAACQNEFGMSAEEFDNLTPEEGEELDRKHGDSSAASLSRLVDAIEGGNNDTDTGDEEDRDGPAPIRWRDV